MTMLYAMLQNVASMYTNNTYNIGNENVAEFPQKSR